MLMGLLGVWNISFLGYPCRAILPYAQPTEPAPSRRDPGAIAPCGRSTPLRRA